LGDQVVVVEQMEMERRRLGGGAVWHQPGCCRHDHDQRYAIFGFRIRMP